MGYKSGTGLGKYEQGRVDIVHASKQRGRRGLGLHIPGLDPSDSAVWDEGKDQVKNLLLYCLFLNSQFSREMSFILFISQFSITMKLLIATLVY